MKEYSPNMGGWAEAVRDIGETDLADKLLKGTRNKKVSLTELKEAGLPKYERLVVPLAEFISHPREILEKFSFPEYYVVLVPHDYTHERYGTIGISAEEILPFVLAQTDNSQGYDLILQEFEKNVYGGTIISDGENVSLVMNKGTQRALSEDRELTDVVTAERKGISFEYSTDDLELRKLMWKVLDTLRSGDSILDTQFLKGYFEFALTEHAITEQDRVLRLVFFDYQVSDVYLKK